MAAPAQTVDDFLQSLPAESRSILAVVRQTILAHLPEGYAECMQGRMIGYVVPHSVYPAGYHCDPRQPLQYAALAVQKNYFSLHLMTIYGDAAMEKWFRKAWEASGKKLDMGKACVRFKKVEDLPLDVVGQLIARTSAQAYIARIEEFMESRSRPRRKRPRSE